MKRERERERENARARTDIDCFELRGDLLFRHGAHDRRRLRNLNKRFRRKAAKFFEQQFVHLGRGRFWFLDNYRGFRHHVFWHHAHFHVDSWRGDRRDGGRYDGLGHISHLLLLLLWRLKASRSRQHHQSEPRWGGRERIRHARTGVETPSLGTEAILGPLAGPPLRYLLISHAMMSRAAEVL